MDTENNTEQDRFAMTEQTVVRLDDVCHYYGPLCALSGISLTLDKGEVLGLLGPNGAGKSTTLAIVSGNLIPASGGVTIAGFDMLREPVRAKAMLGYLADQPPLYRELTVDEYLMYCARLNRVAANERHAAMEHVKRRCGLRQAGRRLIGNLSKGYQQRVGIAQALIHNPPVVILDEPTVGLDPLQIQEVRNLINELRGDHAVILSTHILPEVQALCDRVEIINQGKLVMSQVLADWQDKAVTAVLLECRDEPDRMALQALEGVAAVADSGENRVLISYQAGYDPGEQIARTCVEQGWGLRALIPQQQSLEQVFVDLISKDNAHPTMAESA
jgi:ABC-2 type transport system ATP-binding protein